MASEDALTTILRAVRLSGSLHFCLSPSGNWRSDAGPSMRQMGLVPGKVVPFHIIAEGSCWLKIDGKTIALSQGDIVAFPFATAHQLGNGDGDSGRDIVPIAELPPQPWSSVPVLSYDDGPDKVRVLCGFLFCSALGFQPLSDCVPTVIHARANLDSAGWMRATTEQIDREIEMSGPVGSPILERLTETMFVQMLRQHIDTTSPAAKGWLAAIADPPVGKCLSVIHQDPHRDWTIQELASQSGMSRSALSDRFARHMDISPIRYIRDWRLHLASCALMEDDTPIATIAHLAGYASEAAFNRAFSRAYGSPPAAWRLAVRAG